MALASDSPDPYKHDLNSSTTWANLYHLLRPLVKRWVYSANVSSWKGQELDITEDIVQEAIIRLYNYSKRAERGEVDPIDTLERMLKVVALNYCRDLQRRERRLLRPTLDERLYEGSVESDNLLDPSELAIDHVYQEWLFERVSKQVVKFPDKQRKALLIDLANLMHFAVQPTPLQQAFLSKGMKLQDFRHPLPRCSQERSRHAACLSLAYKRVANL